MEKVSMNEVIKVSDLKMILRGKKLPNYAEIVVNVENQIFDIKQLVLSKCDCCDTPILMINCQKR